MRERRRGAGDREHVGVVLRVGRNQQRDDLRLVAPAGGEERPDRPIDEPARQHFLLGRLALALEESARDAARRVGVFAVVDREREKVDAVARVGRVAGGDDDHRVARADDDGAVGLFGQLAGFDRKRAGAERDFASMCCGDHEVSRQSKVRGRGPVAPVRRAGARRRFERRYLRMPSLRISSAYRSASLRFR